MKIERFEDKDVYEQDRRTRAAVTISKNMKSAKLPTVNREPDNLSNYKRDMERMLLRKLADNYYGVCLVRVIEGIVHNLNGPLQILYIRSEQLEQSLEQLRGTLLSACNAQVEQSEALTEVEVLAGRMEERIKSISRSLDDLNAQMRHLTSDLIVDGCCEIGDVKINQVIEDCLLLLNADMFFKHNVKKTVKLNDALPLLKGRKTDFCIIILNLIQNALEAMVDAQDRHLTVETSCQEDKVIIRVQDTGCGIPEPDREHIYEAFFTTKKGTGHEARLDEHAGLGLSLVSLLLEDYNGTIACESVPGKTTFIVQLSPTLPSVKKMAARKKRLSKQS